jgi:Na+:H+ antiporter, NhaA family
VAQSPSSSNTDVVASLVLLAAAVAALVVANSGLAGGYNAVLKTPLTVGFAPFAITDSLQTWIKNALMAVFFLLVGLEIKAEFKEGALSDRQRAILPFAAALGGMIAPALIYLSVVGAASAEARGWAIPCATDIAFAVGIVGLLGKRVPAPLKAFLLAVAVIDDLGAILIIAFFYTAGLDLGALAIVLAIVAVLAVLNWRGVSNLWIYIAIGVVLWIFVYRSGVNPTLAGVITALFVPLKALDGVKSPLHDLAHAIKWPVTFLIMPIFAFANAGVSLQGLGLADLAQPVTSGISLGLLLGKPIGITLFTAAVVLTGIARLPESVTWTQVLGVGFIAGIGFTMSLFVGVLAFEGMDAMMNAVRLGVLSGSTVAAIAGAIILIMAAGKASPARG